jgi:hypothetical protein
MRLNACISLDLQASAPNERDKKKAVLLGACKNAFQKGLQK